MAAVVASLSVWGTGFVLVEKNVKDPCEMPGK